MPYLAGVLALGWQIRPDLTSFELLDFVFDTAYVAEGEAKVIDPPSLHRGRAERGSE